MLFATQLVPFKDEIVNELAIECFRGAWRVRDTDGGLLLTLVAARALKGDWAGASQDGRWRLQVRASSSVVRRTD